MITETVSWLGSQNNSKWLFDRMFPKKDIIFFKKKEVPYETNGITFRNVLIYGAQGSFKTNTVRGLAEEAVKRYGESEVNATNILGNINLVFGDALMNKTANIIYVDDITGVKLGDEQLQSFNRIRHLLKDKTGMDQGLVITIFGAHGYFEIQKALRVNFNGVIATTHPDNDRDKSSLRRRIGNKGIEVLASVRENVERGITDYRKVFAWGDRSGVMDLGLPDQNYLVDFKYNPSTGERV